MSKIEVDAIEPQSGTSLTLGASGDTITIPSGATFDSSAATTTLPATVVTTTGTQTLSNKTIDATQLTGTITPTDGTVSLAKLTATGTQDATTFLRGDNTFAEAGGGKVLQVVQGISTTAVYTTSSTYVTTGLSASITPSATSSKILVLSNFASQIATSSGTIRLTLKRGSTDIDTSGDGFAKLRVTASNLFGNTPMNVLDSPATTSSTTYEAFFKSSSGNAEVMAGNSSGIMILIEIGA